VGASRSLALWRERAERVADQWVEALRAKSDDGLAASQSGSSPIEIAWQAEIDLCLLLPSPSDNFDDWLAAAGEWEARRAAGQLKNPFAMAISATESICDLDAARQERIWRWAACAQQGSWAGLFDKALLSLPDMPAFSRLQTAMLLSIPSAARAAARSEPTETAIAAVRRIVWEECETRANSIRAGGGIATSIGAVFSKALKETGCQRAEWLSAAPVGGLVGFLETGLFEAQAASMLCAGLNQLDSQADSRSKKQSEHLKDAARDTIWLHLRREALGIWRRGQPQWASPPLEFWKLWPADGGRGHATNWLWMLSENLPDSPWAWQSFEGLRAEAGFAPCETLTPRQWLAAIEASPDRALNAVSNLWANIEREDAQSALSQFETD